MIDFDRHVTPCFTFMILFAAQRYHQLSLIHGSDLIALQSCLQYSTQVIGLVMKLFIFATLIIVTIFVDKIDNELKILWLSTFIDKFNLSIDNFRQILSCIDLSTTFSIDYALRVETDIKYGMGLDWFRPFSLYNKRNINQHTKLSF